VPLALAEPDLRAALDAHRRALEALTAARERFLDLRGLIELVYGQEKRLQQALSAALAMKDTSLAELLPTLTDLQKRNLARGPRLASMLEEARAALARSSGAGHAGGNGKGGDDKQERAARAQRLEIASTLRDKAFDAMKGAAKALGASDANAATSKVDEATRHLEALRRLFFTVVERLREALRQQVELDDDTQKVAALEEAKKRPAALAPLGERQGALRKHVVGIAVALQAQAAQDPSAVAGRKPDPKSKAEAARRSETLKRAGALVGEGAKSMGTAHDGMRAAPPDLDAVRKAQDDATGKLAKALALLQPPPRTKRKPKGGKGQEKPKPGKRKKEEGKKGDEKQPEADPARLLQAVRDREARRQREKSRRKHGGYTPVEKDW
jgi:hypothetical protein